MLWWKLYHAEQTCWSCSKSWSGVQVYTSDTHSHKPRAEALAIANHFNCFNIPGDRFENPGSISWLYSAPLIPCTVTARGFSAWLAFRLEGSGLIELNAPPGRRQEWQLSLPAAGGHSSEGALHRTCVLSRPSAGLNQLMPSGCGRLELSSSEPNSQSKIPQHGPRTAVGSKRHSSLPGSMTVMTKVPSRGSV